MTLIASGTLNLGTAGSTTSTIRYEVKNAYGAYGLVEANTDTSQGLTMTSYYGYTHATIPTAPNKCTTDNGSFWIECNWNDLANDEDGFDIEWSIAGGAYGSAQTAPANATNKIFGGSCQSSVSYRARVRSYNTAGSSSWCTGTLLIAGSQCPS